MHITLNLLFITEPEVPDLIMTGSDISDKKIQNDCSLEKKPIVPNINLSIDRINVLNKCLQPLTRTRLHSERHKACVCVICDCFIIGTEKLIGYQKRIC